MGEDIVTMRGKELRRVHVIDQLIDMVLTQVKAGRVLGVTPREVRRLMRRVQQDGEVGLVHRGRGNTSNRWIPEVRRERILAAVSEPLWRLWADVDGREIGRAAWTGGACGDVTTLVASAGHRPFSASAAAASGVAGTQGLCGGVSLAGWLAP